MKSLRIDMLSPMPKVLFSSPAPAGITMTGLRSDPAAGPSPDSLFAIVDIGKDVAIALFTSWLFERIKDYNAKRIRINGREPQNRADFDRIVREELEIGKND